MLKAAISTIMAATMLTAPLSLYDFETGKYSDMSYNPVIVDLDFCGDVDDAVAIRMATTLDSMHVCTLKAIGLCTTDPSGNHSEVKAAHGLLSYDGYADIPIGTDMIGYKESYSKYWDAIKSYSTTDPVTKPAVELYKNVLDKSYNKVTIITTGYLTNIEALLKDSKGKELVESKCEKIVITGGSKDKWDNNFAASNEAVEAVKYVNENSPVPLIYVPQEVAGDVLSGGIVQQKNPEDPLSKALSAWGTNSGRASWDPCAVLIGCLPEESLPFVYSDVKATFDEKGNVTFTFYGNDTGTKLVMRKSSLTTQRLQSIIEGILGYKYSGG